MTVARLAVSFDKRLAQAVRVAAGKESISSWLADAAQRKLRARGLANAVAEWEAEHGTLRESELLIAERRQSGRKRR